jgi:hypothetical protein
LKAKAWMPGTRPGMTAERSRQDKNNNDRSH